MKKKRSDGDNICPCVERPFDNCFVNRLSSYTIKDVVQYCGRNYESCEIYRRNKRSKRENERTALIQ